MSEPQFVKVKAVDVKPYKFGLWCTVADGPPHANAIIGAKWAEDGQTIWFMLDSHNFYKAAPDETLELVPLSDFWANRPAGRSAAEQKRPVPTKACERCGGTGKAPA